MLLSSVILMLLVQRLQNFCFHRFDGWPTSL